MYLYDLIDESTLKFKEPSLLLVLPPPIFKTQGHILAAESHIVNFPDEVILETFSKNEKTTAIVIAGYEPMMDIIDLRSFIFSARKFFPPENRPPIVIYTTYFYDELQWIPCWNGLYCELLQYGYIYLKCGREQGRHSISYFNKDLGCRLSDKKEMVVIFDGHRYN